MEFRMYNNDTVKFKHDGERFCLHVQQDDDPFDPRTDWDHPGTHMVCWHWSYRLGDNIEDKKPEEVWQRLVRENVPESEILSAAEAGKLDGIRVTRNEENHELADVYGMYIEGSERIERLDYEGVFKDAVATYLIDILTIDQCMVLLEPYVVWLPLWLYDHSGISMSCGIRNPYNDCWDSGKVGWIYTTKNEAIKEIGYRENDWKERAIHLMEAEVKEYDQYLTGDVYGFTLLKKVDVEAEDDDSAWEEVDSCWGFYGSDVFESGMYDNVPGLREALESGDYEEGEAKLVVTSHYTYPTST